MLAEVYKTFEPVLRQRNVDFVVELGEVLTGADAFRSDHEIPDGENDGAVGEAIGVKGLIGDDLLEEDGVGPFIDGVVIAGLVGQQGLINGISVDPGDVGMEGVKVPLEGLLQFILHGLCGRDLHEEVGEVVTLL
jgi:hypothetical protein